MSRRIDFFATQQDLLRLLGEVEVARSVCYAEAGMSDQSDVVIYASAAGIPNLGLVHVHSPHHAPFFLMADVGTILRSEPIVQRRGGVRHSVSQSNNPDTISLMPGGRFDDQTLLGGNFGTCTDSQVSRSLLNAVASAVRRQWKGVKSYAVGPEAMKVLDAGGRLTGSLRAPREYDLQR